MASSHNTTPPSDGPGEALDVAALEQSVAHAKSFYEYLRNNFYMGYNDEVSMQVGITKKQIRGVINLVKYNQIIKAHEMRHLPPWTPSGALVPPRCTGTRTSSRLPFVSSKVSSTWNTNRQR